MSADPDHSGRFLNWGERGMGGGCGYWGHPGFFWPKEPWMTPNPAKEPWMTPNPAKYFDTTSGGLTANIATATVTNHDGGTYVAFTTKDWVKNMAQINLARIGDGPNGEVYVRAFADDTTDTLSAVTLGKHMIVGIRQWSVQLAQSDNGEAVMTIFTAAWERRNGYVTDWGFKIAGKTDMLKIWRIYLGNIARQLVGKTAKLTNGFIQVRYFEDDVRELNKTKNPFSTAEIIPIQEYRQ
jgi:hypothetical protein